MSPLRRATWPADYEPSTSYTCPRRTATLLFVLAPCTLLNGYRRLDRSLSISLGPLCSGVRMKRSRFVGFGRALLAIARHTMRSARRSRAVPSHRRSVSLLPRLSKATFILRAASHQPINKARAAASHSIGAEVLSADDARSQKKHCGYCGDHDQHGESDRATFPLAARTSVRRSD